MAPDNKAIFLQLWPKCFINFMAFIELIAVIIMFITELGNVAANFWVTNVFAGGWCGLILFIHIIFSFKSACCSPGPAPAFRAAVVGVIGLIASTALISFDAAFIAQPSTCILTSSCVDNSVSNTTFSYTFQQSFFTVFNSWSPFKSYAQPQVKALCQTIQLGVGGLGFIICIIYLIVYYSCSSKAKKQVEPAPRQRPGHSVPPPQPYYGAPAQPQPYYGPSAPIQPPPPQAQPVYYPSPPPPVVPQGVYPGVPTQRYYQPPAVAWGPQPVPQVQPGVIPYNPNRIY